MFVAVHALTASRAPGWSCHTEIANCIAREARTGRETSGDLMCLPSVVADDWIGIGFHVHVDGIELAVRPDHSGGVTFSSVFSAPAEVDVQAAIRRAFEECLPNDLVRKRWVSSVQRAKLHLVSHQGVLRDLAIGRVAEMHFLEIALNRYKG
jgi:hypothetical protein